jgi:hypothetical protein
MDEFDSEREFGTALIMDYFFGIFLLFSSLKDNANQLSRMMGGMIAFQTFSIMG